MGPGLLRRLSNTRSNPLHPAKILSILITGNYWPKEYFSKRYAYLQKEANKDVSRLKGVYNLINTKRQD